MALYADSSDSTTYFSQLRKVLLNSNESRQSQPRLTYTQWTVQFPTFFYRVANTVKLHCIQAKENKLDAKPMLKTQSLLKTPKENKCLWLK